MVLRFVNGAILALVTLLTLTGIYGLFWTFNGWLFDLHRIAAWALIALIPWKTGISLTSLKRGLQPRFDRGVMIMISLLLASLAIMVLVLPLLWTWNIGPWWVWLGQTNISWHWMLALGIVPPFILHAWRRWPRPKRSDFLTRRAALRTLALSGAAVTGWMLTERLADSRAAPDAMRRYTGSRHRTSFTGNDFPVTNGAGEGKIRLDPRSWRLTLDGAVNNPITFTYNDLLAINQSDVIATVDCTLGWYSTQRWSGVWLSDLLSRADLSSAAASVRLLANSDYRADYSLAEAQDILLATHVGGEVLNHWHGFPVRAVVPFRRGWFWVKWVSRIEILNSPRAAVPYQTSPRELAVGPHSLL